MLANHEVWKYSGDERVWAGKYKNSHNLLHWHYDCELLYVEKGSIDVFCDKKMHSLKTADALFVDSGELHYMKAKPGTTLIVIIFDNSLSKPIIGNMQLKNPQLSHNYGIAYTYKKIRTELTNKSSFYGEALKNEIIGLLINIFRNEECVLKLNNAATSIHLFKRLFEEISEKYEFFTFKDAASFMGMSPSYFSRLFHQSSGMTFSHYLNCIKIKNAVQLLQSGNSLSVTDIAMKCGFATIRNFNRIFKDLTGHQPKRLPSNYIFDENFISMTGSSFNPTLSDCELIECPPPG